MGEVIGRRNEMSALQRSLASAATGVPRATLLEGEPGIGKTHLLAAFAREAEAAGACVLRVGITDAESDVSWAGMSMLLDQLEPTALELSAPSQRRILDRARGRTTQGSVEADDVAWALADLLGRLGTASTTVLVLDDLHWLDRASAGAIAVAIRSNLRRRIAIVGARRLDVHVALDLDRIAGLAVERVRLGGLSVGGVYELLAERGLTDLRRPDVIRIHELSGGNPLFAVELAELHRRGRPVSDIDSIDGLRGVAMARLALLDPAAVDAARVCALMVHPTISAVREVVGADADDALVELERRGIITCDGERLAFTHPLRRAAALEGLGVLERRRYHRRIADAIDDPDEAVVHRSEAADAPDEVLAAALERLADESAAQGVPDVAAARYRRAAHLTPPGRPGDRWRRSHRAVRCSIMAGDEDVVSDEATRLLDEAEDDGDVLAAVLDVLEVVHRTSGLEAAAAWAPTGRARLAHRPALEVAVVERMLRIEQLRDLPEAARLAREALELAMATGEDDVIDRARVLVASTGLLAGERVDLTQLPRLIARSSEPGMDASMFLAELLVWVNDVERAQDVLGPMEVRARASGRGAPLVRVLAQVGDLHLRSGRWDSAEIALEEAIEVGDLIGYDIGARSDLAWLHAARGHQQLARELIGVAARAVPTAPKVHLAQILARRGAVHLFAGEWRDAADDLAAARVVAESIGLTAEIVLPIGPDLVEALVQIGQLDRAHTEVERLRAAALRCERPFDEAITARSRAVLAGACGDGDDAAQRALEAVELHALGPDAPFEEARSRLVAGAALRRVGRRRDARQQAEVARTMFQALGALPFVRRAEGELARLGTRQAPAGLSSTEQRVAQLAAAGRTNVEIATELVVSVRTVESNLTRAYRKLGVRSRTELGARLASQP